MTTNNPSMISGPGFTQRSKTLERIRQAIRAALGAVAWGLLTLATLLTGYFAGWALLAAVKLSSVPQSQVLSLLLVLLAVTAGLAWLVARFVAPARTVGPVVGITFALVVGAWAIWTFAFPDRALFLAREVSWGDSSQKDYEKFPERAVDNTAPAFHFKQDPSPELFQAIEFNSEGELVQTGFEEFLQSTQTTSFIVIKDDVILYEGYFNGYNRDSIVTSFSVAKSFTSALVGIAIDEGYIQSVDDLMIDYLPELKGKGFDALTIRHLLTMSSGIQYLKDDELSPLEEIMQFTDDGLSYSYPNLRSLALQVRPDGGEVGARFNYNNYHPLLLGMILERTTGRPVAEYLQEKIWKPLGMEYPASWSLDSEQSGFELMGAGVNARAIDFAKFGRLVLNNGEWNGAQIISEEWVKESTSPDPDDNRPWHSDADWKEASGYYKYLWWGKIKPDGGYDFIALGKRGQRIYVSPQEQVIIVRFGLDYGGVDSWEDVFQSLVDKVKGSEQTVPTEPSAAQDWPTSTPEEQGFDSAKLAEGLRAIQENGTKIHSLMLVRNGSVFLDAYFYPYDGTIYHDLASVTKSVMTTLIGIAADQGKLDLDQPMLSFFPDRAIANRSDRKERITVRHLASMTAGLQCDARDDEKTLELMRASEDWVQFALDRRVVGEPGIHFTYCGLQMHLLSAILQEATGMTALDFARENLFEPLRITNVYWPADPQGYNHGWGDLCLYPHDMAKIGYLFLNQGQWQGQQVVSSAWISEATTAQIATGSDRAEDYGYGWWIAREGNEYSFFRADGSRGQRILVIPSLDLVLVTTGGGFTLDEITPYVVAAIGDTEEPLPLNPTAVEQLVAVATALKQPPAPQAVPPLPETAGAISGKTYVFELDALQLRSLRLDFDAGLHPVEAFFQLDLANEQSPRPIVVGLDGVYRPSQGGRPILARGGWEDAQTFVIDYDEGPGISTYTFRIYFEGDRMTFEISGLGSFEATLGQP